MRSASIALLLGILCFQQLSALPDEHLVQFLPLCLLLAWGCRRLRLAAIFLAGFLFALLRAHLAVAALLPASLDGPDLTVSGRIVGVPTVRGPRTRFEFRVEQLARETGTAAPFAGRVRLSWYGAPRLEAGERWRLPVRLRAPRGYANPGGFDYARWLFVRGIRATGYVRASPDAQRLEPAPVWHLDRWRQEIARAVGTALRGRAAAGVIAALAVGERGGIDAQQWRVFRDTGTAHLMAISGLHVGLVAALWFGLARWIWSRIHRACLLVPAQRAGAVAGFAAGLAYAGMAGFSLPTQRALVMLAVVMWCLGTGRATAFSVVLCAALVAVLLLDPFSVLGPSLWLSFGAVAVLAFGSLHRNGAAARGPAGLWWRWGRAQLLAALGLAPVLLASFGQLPLLSPLANVIAIPWTGFLVVPATLAGSVLLGMLPETGALLLKLAATLLELLWPALDTLARGGVMLTPSGRLPAWALAAGAVGVLLLMLPREIPGRWLGCLWLAPLLALTPPAPPAGALWLTLLDVGHGLAAVVRTRHHVLVFDVGPRYPGGFDAGERLVAPFLRSQGLFVVERIIVSHADNDHAGGLEGLLTRITAGDVIGGPGHRCAAGRRWRWDGYRFELLHPPPAAGFDGNDASCVLRVTGPGGSLLIPGDIEAAAERSLLARYGDGLGATILVAPHHGSATSSTAGFVTAVRPRWVLFSAGDRRRPRLPDEAVMARYQAAGARTLVTARTGAIQVRLTPGAAPAVSGWRETNRRYWEDASQPGR